VFSSLVQLRCGTAPDRGLILAICPVLLISSDRQAVYCMRAAVTARPDVAEAARFLSSHLQHPCEVATSEGGAAGGVVLHPHARATLQPATEVGASTARASDASHGATESGAKGVTGWGFHLAQRRRCGGVEGSNTEPGGSFEHRRRADRSRSRRGCERAAKVLGGRARPCHADLGISQGTKADADGPGQHE
jgi:hypothetical protein